MYQLLENTACVDWLNVYNVVEGKVKVVVEKTGENMLLIAPKI